MLALLGRKLIKLLKNWEKYVSVARVAVQRTQNWNGKGEKIDMENAKFRKFASVAVVLGTASFAHAAGAATVLDKALDASEFGWNSNISSTFQQSTDDVQLASDATVDAVEWYGFRGDGSASFTIRFFDNAADGVNTSPFFSEVVTATAVDTGLNQGNHDIFKYSANFSAILLAAGVRYDLSIAQNSDTIWTWSHSSPEAGSLFHRNGDADSWRDVAGSFGEARASHAFSLQSSDVAPVPLPASLPLLLAAFGGIAVVGRRRKSA